MRGRRPREIDFSCVGLSSGSSYPHLPDTRQNRAGMGISMPVSTRSKIRTGSTRYLPTQGIFGRVHNPVPGHVEMPVQATKLPARST
eukprot:scaffold14893_cov104-Skeletonema_dohrnii-CCMP3373.AAC.1